MNLLDQLKRSPLLCDGAMGTLLMAAGMTSGQCAERWNVDQPDAVEAIHRAYRNAGCRLITTNSFGGSPLALARHGLEQRVDQLNGAAAQIARRGAGSDACILGDIGPFGGFLEPVGDTPHDQARDGFARQAQALHEGGADAFIIETMVDPQEMILAITAARAVGRLPVIATYAFDKPAAGDGPLRTMMGTTVADALHAAIDAGADVVGANCGTSLDLDDYRRLSEQLLAAAGQAPVILQPNAGSPAAAKHAQPHDMAALAEQLIQNGVRIIGGCCGTTPDHLRAMAQAIAAATDQPF